MKVSDDAVGKSYNTRIATGSTSIVVGMLLRLLTLVSSIMPEFKSW